MEDFTTINTEQISELLKRFSSQSYSSRQSEKQDEQIIDICIQLWQLDYRCEIIENKGGSLCSTYPSRIAVPIYEIGVEVPELSPLSNEVLIEISSPLKKKDVSVIPELPQDTATQVVTPEKSTNPPKLSPSCETDKKDDEENSFESTSLPDTSKETLAAPTFSAVVANSPCKKANGEQKSSVANSPCKKANEKQESSECSSSTGSLHKFTLREVFSKANLARCRYRFPIPSILCKGKYVSRSATLSCYIDVIGKQMLYRNLQEFLPKHNDVDKARNYDIKLLEAIGTSHILDLMVENKKVKYSINVSSSEKADKENRYSKFSITSIPYPGCEFFREFTLQNLSSLGLFYNWNEPFNDATLSLAEDSVSMRVTTDWTNYEAWDLRKMTENYLKLVLKYLLDDDSKETGFLVHCISGWDRTPLFISLIRLSLWADGLVHCSLDAKQMLFFTLAYDWYLFGHQLPERLKCRESIMYFCFEFLEEIYSESFMDSVEKKESFMDSMDKKERHTSSESCTSGPYDSATVGVETAASSFESATSLASSSPSSTTLPPPPSSASPSSTTLPPPPSSASPSSTTLPSASPSAHPSSHPSASPSSHPSASPSSHPSASPSAHPSASPSAHPSASPSASPSAPTIKISPLKQQQQQQQQPPPAEACHWPFNKENGFTFDGISENEGSSLVEGGVSPYLPKASPSRSPLKERNKGSPKATPPSAGKGGGGRKANLNGFLRDFPGRRSRKSSSSDSAAASRLSAGSDVLESNSADGLGSEVDCASGGVPCAARGASNPVPVPGVRSRHSSSSSSVGSWQLISNSDPLKESLSMSFESHRSSRTSLTADMVDSTNTILEEATPSSSLESSQSIIVFNRQRRLSEVREMFFQLYSKEVADLFPDHGFVLDIVNNLIKLGN